MIISMPTTARLQQRYDNRLRNLVQRTGVVTVDTGLGVPRSRARGWLGATPTVVTGLDVVDLTAPELRREILKLRRLSRRSLAVQPALALLRTELSLTGERLPQGRAKVQILRAVDRAREYLPLRAVLRIALCVAESVPRLVPPTARVCVMISPPVPAYPRLD